MDIKETRRKIYGWFSPMAGEIEKTQDGIKTVQDSINGVQGGIQKVGKKDCAAFGFAVKMKLNKEIA